MENWLKSISLEQYAECFTINQIDGRVLVDIGLDDLDYMGITVLAHRKLILKGIEGLKESSKPNSKVSKDYVIFRISTLFEYICFVSNVMLLSVTRCRSAS